MAKFGSALLSQRPHYSYAVTIYGNMEDAFLSCRRQGKCRRPEYASNPSRITASHAVLPIQCLPPHSFSFLRLWLFVVCSYVITNLPNSLKCLLIHTHAAVPMVHSPKVCSASVWVQFTKRCQMWWPCAMRSKSSVLASVPSLFHLLYI